MTTALFETPDVGTELKRFSPADTAIAAMREEFMPLTIAGIDDAEGYKRVHAARMIVKNHRVNVEKVRKELKADALEYGKRVDNEAKRITALLTPIESHLEGEEGRIDAEKEAIKNAARLKAEAEARAKAEAEAAALKAAHEAENARLAAEREKLYAERKAMEAERARQDAAHAAERQRLAVEQARVAAEQKAAQEKIDAERRAVEAEQRQIDMEKAKAEAAEKARIETEARMKWEAAEAAIAEDQRLAAIDAARARAEALRPDREKLLAVADSVRKIELPQVSPIGQQALNPIDEALDECEAEIRRIVGAMQ